VKERLSSASKSLEETKAWRLSDLERLRNTKLG